MEISTYRGTDFRRTRTHTASPQTPANQSARASHATATIIASPARATNPHERRRRRSSMDGLGVLIVLVIVVYFVMKFSDNEPQSGNRNEW